ncbi:type II toxin-antitoxin system Phd/YefM family antitoxin [uncultured Zhongshania sp.]|uniref:type II toxin-antitoxin system Phd/YefM family antitoxin n=1 Tax=uncultured Zhongshania sp. TaxID=1642288 RepID=UPI0025FE5E6B|nr:type II toxin-antitoxin system Phd/YefM family antitoxin [uncultured Zhongshania sp.]
MTIDTIPISRLKRELNQVLRKLARNRVDVYVVTRKGQPVVYLLSVNHYENLLAEMDKLAEQLERLDIDDSI